jgi:hypothetical protein
MGLLKFCAKGSVFVGNSVTVGELFFAAMGFSSKLG